VGLLGGILIVTLLAPWLTPYDPREAEPEAQFEPPSSHHPFGTDLLGRDVYTRVLYGGQRTLGMGALAILVTLIPGALIGLVAGYAGRWIDWALMTLLDALLAFPSLLLALSLLAVFGSGIHQIAIAVGIAGIPPYARVTRAAVLEARTRPFVEASRAVGARPAGILWRHVVPTVLPPMLAFAGVSLSWALLNGAALVFLGYGGDISAPDWGAMLADGRQAFRTAPWVAAAPGIMLSLTVFAITTLSRALGRVRR
jgi:peptide/nickel transport system permease protein